MAYSLRPPPSSPIIGRHGLQSKPIKPLCKLVGLHFAKELSQSPSNLMPKTSRPFHLLSFIMLLAFGLFLGRGLPTAAAGGAGPLLITEFMANNVTTLADEDGTFADWIEVHNPTGAAVDLTGWYLTDSAADLTKWTFPTRTLNAGATLIIFASNKNRTGAELHTNFALSLSGEYLALVQPDGLTIAWEYAPPSPPNTPMSRMVSMPTCTSVFTQSPPPAVPTMPLSPTKALSCWLSITPLSVPPRPMTFSLRRRYWPAPRPSKPSPSTTPSQAVASPTQCPSSTTV